MSENTPQPVVGEAPPSSNVWLSNRAYDRLKFLTQIVLPGLGTLYFALAVLWDLPKPEEVVGTIVAFTAFLGLFLGASSKQYKNSDARFDGAIVISPHPEDVNASNVNVQVDRASLEQKDEVTVRVKHRDLL